MAYKYPFSKIELIELCKSIHDSGGRGHLKKSLAYTPLPKKIFGPNMEKFGQKMSFFGNFDQPSRFSQICCKIS
jgi:hypothetical protein